MEIIVAKLGLKERSFTSKRARIFVLALSSAWILVTAPLVIAGNGTFNDNIGLALATSMVIFAGADFLHYRHEYLALLLRAVASLMGVVALVVVLLRAASVIGIV